jgi:hypothetical protein
VRVVFSESYSAQPRQDPLRLSFLTLLAAMSLAGAASAFAQTIPPVNAKALDDSQVVLPQPGSHQYLILTIGFSHKSGEPSAAWGKRLFADFSSNPQVAVYQLAELQSAPSFIHGVIVHGMRKDVPATHHSHFVPLFDHADEWKKLVNFSGPDDSYVLLTTPDGHVLWQTHGPVNDAAYAELQTAVAHATNSSSAR